MITNKINRNLLFSDYNSFSDISKLRYMTDKDLSIMFRIKQKTNQTHKGLKFTKIRAICEAENHDFQNEQILERIVCHQVENEL